MIKLNRLISLRLLPLYLFSLIIPLVTYGYAVGKDYMYATYLFALYFMTIPTYTRKCTFTHNLRIYSAFAFLVFLSSINLFDGTRLEYPIYQTIAYSLIPYLTIIFIYSQCKTTPMARDYVMLYGIVLFILGVYRYSRSEEVISIIGSNQIANNAFYYSLMCLPLVLLTKSHFLRIIAILLTALICIMSVKRTALIAIALISAIYMLQSVKFKSKSRMVMSLTAMALFTYYILHSSVFERLDAVNNRMEQVQEDGGSGRSTMYLRFLEKDYHDIISFPAVLIGKGFKAYHRKYGDVEAVHNDYLELLYSYGTLGLCFMIWCLVKTIKLLRHYRKNTDYSLAYWSFTILFIIYSFTGGVFTFICNMLPMYIFMGYMESVNSQARQKLIK